MDKVIARQVLRAAFHSGRELEGLLRLLKERCSAREYESYARAIGRAIDGIGAEVINKVLEAHPDLTEEIEANLKNSGRAM